MTMMFTKPPKDVEIHDGNPAWNFVWKGAREEVACKERFEFWDWQTATNQLADLAEASRLGC